MTRDLVRIVLLAFSILLFATSTRAQVIYQVTVDTSPIQGQDGYLDLQFNPGGLDTLDATVTIGPFTSDGRLALTSQNTGNAYGNLPGPPSVILNNTSGFNDLFQGITFGNSIGFNAVFVGSALSPGGAQPRSGSVFALSIYDSTGTLPLLSTSQDGSMLHIDIDPSGTVSPTLFPDVSGIERAKATLVPEPSSVGLAEALIACMVLCVRRRKNDPDGKPLRRRMKCAAVYGPQRFGACAFLNLK